MKKQLIILVLSGISCLYTFIFAQDIKSNFKNEFRMELFPLVQNKLLLHYERTFPKIGHVIKCGIIRLEESRTNTYGFELHYGPRFYLFECDNSKYEHVITKVYFTPSVLYRNITYDGKVFDGTKYKDKVTSYGLNLIFGVKYLVHNRFIFDFGGGAKYHESVIHSNIPGKYVSGILDSGFIGISFVMRCSLGFTF